MLFGITLERKNSTIGLQILLMNLSPYWLMLQLSGIHDSWIEFGVICERKNFPADSG